MSEPGANNGHTTFDPSGGQIIHRPTVGPPATVDQGVIDRISALTENKTRLIIAVAEIAAEEQDLLVQLAAVERRLESLTSDLLRVDNEIDLERKLRDPVARRRAVAALRPRRKAPRDPTRRLAHVLALLGDEPDRRWSAADIQDALRVRDDTITAPTVHALEAQLGRWVQHGILRREGRGSYRLGDRTSLLPADTDTRDP